MEEFFYFRKLSKKQEHELNENGKDTFSMEEIGAMSEVSVNVDNVLYFECVSDAFVNEKKEVSHFLVRVVFSRFSILVIMKTDDLVQLNLCM